MLDTVQVVYVVGGKEYSELKDKVEIGYSS